MVRMYDSRTGRELGVRNEQPIWRKEGARHALFIPQTISVPDGRAEIGGIDTGITVYPSGTLLIPGEPSMKFASEAEARLFAETHVALKGDADDR